MWSRFLSQSELLVAVAPGCLFVCLPRDVKGKRQPIDREVGEWERREGKGREGRGRVREQDGSESACCCCCCCVDIRDRKSVV